MSDQSGHDINYKKIYYTLLILLVISVAGPFLGIFWVTLITAFGIALVKANLVVQNFMHLKTERQIMKWVLAGSLVLMFLLFAGVAADVMKHEGANWENTAAKAAVARGIPDADHAEESGEEHGEGSGEESGAEAGAPEGGAAVAVAGAAEAAAFDAEGAFQAVCATCHGLTGGGDGPGSAALEPKPAAFDDRAFWETRTEADMVTVILQGGAAIGKSPLMPPWNALYDQAKAEALVAYIRETFAPAS
jgi:caa(3)-type oxidase subunit IV